MLQPPLVAIIRDYPMFVWLLFSTLTAVCSAWTISRADAEYTYCLYFHFIIMVFSDSFTLTEGQATSLAHLSILLWSIQICIQIQKHALPLDCPQKMSRDLTHYFSCASDDPKKAKVKHVSQCDDGSDFENDDVMPLKNGNSIKRYFSRAEKMFEKAPQKCSVTVQAVVHESPPEHIQTKKSIKIKTKTQKRLGISSRQADLIEVVNTDQVDTQQRVSKTPTSVGTKADIESELRGGKIFSIISF